MMTCRELYGFLDAFLDGRLEASTLADFEGHLARCRACRRYLDSYRTTIALARASEHADGLATMEAPRELVDMILKARGSAKAPESEPPTR